MAIECQVIRAGEISAHLDKLAYLRTMVFREWPYLYDGDPDNERDYLRNYAVPGAVLVLAEDAGRVVGAATAMALTSHGDAVQMSLPPSAPPPKEIYYLAESVLLPEFRGQGIGHRFFDCREEAALENGFEWSGFASVLRPKSHPARPKNARSHDAFWQKRGYAPLTGAVAEFTWTDVGDTQPTSKPLQFWLKPL